MTNTPKVLRCRWVQRVQVYLAVIPGSSEQVKCTIFSLRTFCSLWYGLFQASWCWESEERMWHRSGDRHKGWRCHALQRECSGQRGAARPCWQQQERNLYCSAPPCLCSENRSMCWFSGARITSRGAEAKAVHSAGSKQDSTRCPSCSHKWHWQISLKGLKGVCKRWGKTQQCMDLWAPRGSFLHKVNSSSVLSGLPKNVTYVPGKLFYLFKTTL